MRLQFAVLLVFTTGCGAAPPHTSIPIRPDTTLPAPSPVAATSPATTGRSARQGVREGDETYEEGDFVLKNVPLEEALATLSERASSWSPVQIEANWEALAKVGVRRDARVSVRLWSPKVGKALQAIFDNANGGKTPQLAFSNVASFSVIRVTTLEDHLSRDGLIREYCLRVFLSDIPGGPAKENAAPPGVRAATREDPIAASSDPGGRLGPAAARSMPTRADRIASLSNLIKETVAPESWDFEQICYVHVDGDKLTIRQVEENHEQIQSLFEQLKEMRSSNLRTVRVRPTTRDTRAGPASQQARPTTAPSRAKMFVSE